MVVVVVVELLLGLSPPAMLMMLGLESERKETWKSKCVNLNLLCCYGGLSPTMLWERSLQNPLVVFISTWTARQPREKEVETVAS